MINKLTFHQKVKNFLSLGIIFLLPFVIYGQIFDDFSDDNMRFNPQWFGDTASFEIIDPPISGNGSLSANSLNDNHVLRSKINTNDAIIVTKNSMAYGEWKFSVSDAKGWSVSSSNDFLVILTSDDSSRTNLKDGSSLNFNGYYLRFDGSNSDQFVLYKQTGTTEIELLNTNFPGITDGSGIPDGYTIKITRNFSGLWKVYIDSVFESTASTLRGSVIDNDHQYSSWFAISTNISTASDTRVMYFDNLSISKDFTSDVVAPLSQIAPDSISSLSDTKNEAHPVLKFVLSDKGPDGLPTLLTSIVVHNAHPANEANWTSNIQGVCLSDSAGNINLDSTHITTDSLVIYIVQNQLFAEDSTDKEITISIYLDSTGIEDGKNLQFYIKANNNRWVADERGSGLDENFTGNIYSNQFILSVAGTQLLFSGLPDTVGINQNFNANLFAVDSNNNYDVDASETVSITLNSGSGNISSATSLTQDLQGGSTQWPDLQYNSIGYFSLSASANNYLMAISDSILSVGNNNSSLVNPTNQVVGSNISSIFDSIEEAFTVFKFVIQDAGAGDQLPTIVQQIELKNAFPANGQAWTSLLKGLRLMSSNEIIIDSTNISDSSIIVSFTDGTLTIADGESMELSALVFLNSSNIIDHSTLQLYIDSTEHGFKAYPDGSTFLPAFNNKLISDIFVIDVTATQLNFLSINEFVAIYNDFSLSAETVDGNYNRDVDNSGNVMLTLKTGNGLLSSISGLTMAATSGIVSWNDLQYNIAEKFIIEASQMGLDPIETDTIQAFLDFYSFNFEDSSLFGWQDTNDWAVLANDPISGLMSLKHNLQDTTGISYINHKLTKLNYNTGTVHWQVIIKNGNWDPTSTNKFGFHLMSNSNNYASDSYSGYAVGVNLSGSDDLLKLWKIENNSYSELISSDYNWDENGQLSIEVSRTAKGIWQLKYTQSMNFDSLIFAGSILDSSFEFNDYFGLFFSYSSTRAGELWYDNLSIFETDDPPFLDEILVIDSALLKLKYSEIISQQFALNTSNYSLYRANSETVNINNIYADTSDFETVYIVTDPLYTDLYTLKVFNIEDTAGLKNPADSIQFNFINTPLPNDVVITEIMADPSPTVSLPEYDYLELYNTTQYPVYLKGWEISIGTKTYTFQVDTIPADSFLIVCPTTAISYFEEFGLSYGLIGTTDLTNSGKKIQIYDDNGKLIHTIQYSDLWYQDEGTENGGYSLEKIDPLNNCSTISNWHASIDSTGGTPGRTNSVNAPNIDVQPPSVTNIEVISNTQIKLGFSEIIDTSNIDLVNFTIDNGIGQPDSIAVEENLQSITLMFSTSFPDEDSSHIIINLLQDLCGNTMSDTSLFFIYYKLKPFDIVINEIMADPSPVIGLPDYEYIEIKNVTAYNLTLDGLLLKVNSHTVILPKIDFPANSFVILCSTSGFNAFDSLSTAYAVTSFPSLTNSGATITITDSTGVVISTVQYSDMWYGADSLSEGGYSLEKIDPLNNCSTSLNWHASIDAAGGTPGKTNSVNASNIDHSSPFVSNIEIISNKELSIYFNEILDTAFIELNNFLVNNGVGLPDSLYVDENLQTVNLVFSSVFPDEDTLQISIANLQDLCANVLSDTTLTFIFYTTKPYDVVISEIMADPEPSVGLPDYDYLEIYNRSGYTLNLKNWQITIGSYTRIFSDVDFYPYTYIILTTEDGLQDLSDYGNTISLISSTDLTSTGKEIILKNQYDTIIDHISYDKTWYHNKDKENGGWSIELIDPNRSCGPFYNWTASENEMGGTPGQNNSVLASNTDNDAPDIESFEIISPNDIQIVFSEYINLFFALDTANYVLSSLGNPDSVIQIERNIYNLHFSNSFLNGIEYELLILNQQDLCNNPANGLYEAFTYFIASPGDIVINELLADPAPIVNLPEYEFIELFNNSNKTLNFKNWTLQVDSTFKQLDAFYIQPDSFLILCSTSADSNYLELGQTLPVKGFPSLPNNGAFIAINDSSGNKIDDINYSKSWYKDDDKTEGGWTLERIDADNLCGGINNWKASEDEKGGTPGSKNSVIAINVDTIAPYVNDLYKINQHLLVLEISEDLLIDSVININNFTVNQWPFYPDSVWLDLSNSILINLYFKDTLQSQKAYNLKIGNLTDNCLNSKTSISIDFEFNKIHAYDIIFSEIMADPEPSQGLPPTEYLEVYNRSDQIISLAGWVLSVGESNSDIPLLNIAPGEQIVFTSNASEFLRRKGNFMELNNMPSLPNTSGVVRLLNDSLKIMSAINYSNSWYTDDLKKDGGYSLEVIDPQNPTGSPENWEASINPLGGTPGFTNSVNADNPDLINPFLAKIAVLNDSCIELFFSEQMDSTALVKLSNFFVDGGIDYPYIANPVEPFYSEVLLAFYNKFFHNTIYHLTPGNQLIDIAGNSLILEEDHPFAIPEKAKFNDIVINEILFNPLADGVDYIELYNRSGKTFDIGQMFLSSRNENYELSNIQSIDKTGILLFDDSYVLLTTNPDKVLEQYFTKNSRVFHKMASLPSMPNDAGTIALITGDSIIIDELSYDENMHLALLNSYEGIALERVDFEQATNQKANWQSAAKNVGYGTPGYENSQHKTLETISDKIKLDPEVFSPNQDGYNDVLNIQYQLDAPGYVANVFAFDASGRLVKKITENELLGTNGFFAWDGSNLQNKKANVGIYIIYFEFFNLDGKVEEFKKVCVLTTNK